MQCRLVKQNLYLISLIRSVVRYEIKITYTHCVSNIFLNVGTDPKCKHVKQKILNIGDLCKFNFLLNKSQVKSLNLVVLKENLIELHNRISYNIIFMS